ncbi:MAG: methylmalonyl-CoA epimerase [Bdellovibrionales bacterium]|nr:methylmalonyl-CoA epimerase [Bdellovibrionales bacterium]
MTLDHIGHAVHDLDAAVERYARLFGLEVIERETIHEHAVEAAFLSHTDWAPANLPAGGYSIELLAPRPGNTVLDKFLSTRGEGLHHICFRVDSVAQELERLKALQVPLIDQIPRAGSRGSQVAFLHPKGASGVLLEICSYPRK